MSVHYEGKVSLAGPLAQRDISIDHGLDLPGGARYWFSEVRPGDVAVLRPGDEFDATYRAGPRKLDRWLRESPAPKKADRLGAIYGEYTQETWR